jgi:hypothetical protein
MIDAAELRVRGDQIVGELGNRFHGEKLARSDQDTKFLSGPAHGAWRPPESAGVAASRQGVASCFHFQWRRFAETPLPGSGNAIAGEKGECSPGSINPAQFSRQSFCKRELPPPTMAGGIFVESAPFNGIKMKEASYG